MPVLLLRTARQLLIRRASLLGLLALLLAGPARGQTDSLASLTRRLQRYQQTALPEKLFLHLDRPLYLSGETMWFKIYAVDGTYHRPLALSSVAYVEVLDKSQRAVLQAKIPLRNAMGQGSFILPASLASGPYTVRAYTAWMQNFDPDAYFHGGVTVVNTFTASGAPATPDSVRYDVQLFPEGGHLVQSLTSKVGVKVTSEDGRSVSATGQVVDEHDQPLVAFQTLRYGMGSFYFTPQPGHAYTAVLRLPTGRRVRVPLPAAQPRGYVLHLEESSPSSALRLTVRATTDQPETLFLLATARQHPALAQRIQLRNGQAEFILDRAQLPAGIAHLTLFDERLRPLAERLHFQPPPAALALTARPDKEAYSGRDKVSVQLSAAGAAPGSARLSVAVFRLDSLTTAPTADIAHYLWLSADLRGTVQDPGYYFGPATPERAVATDNLLLTQGWSRFRWEQVLAPDRPALPYLPELHGPLVRGRVVQARTGRPLPGLTTYLAAPSRIVRLTAATSNAAGLVQFELDEVYGSHDLIAQTDPRQDSTARVELLPFFSDQFARREASVYTAPTVRFQSDFTRRHLQTQVQNAYFGQYRNRYRVPPADSTAFYGQPDEVYLLDRYTRFKVLEEVMREYVPGVVVRIRKDGFHFMVLDKVNQTVLSENPMVLLDGVPIFNLNKMMAMDPLRIRRLDVLDSRYFHGPSIYDGLVSYTTYKGDLEEFPLDARVLVQQYEGLQYQREFYAPRYDTPQARQSRLPDLRNLLYWNPDARTSSTGSVDLEFYTGDQAGRYRIVVQGLSDAGLAGSTSTDFEVKPAL